MSTERRALPLNCLDDVVQELDHLLTNGYCKTGKWDLAQTCEHLDDWIRFSLDGYPKAPAPIRLVLWLMKITSGRRQFQNVLKNGFRDGLPTMPATVHSADYSAEQSADADADAAQRLAETINRFDESTGPIHPSPLYGSLSRDEAMQLHLVHCAHHLRFLVPNPEPRE